MSDTTVPARLPAGIEAVTTYQIVCATDSDCDWWDYGDHDGVPVWTTPDAARDAARELSFRLDAVGGLHCRQHADTLGLPDVEPSSGQLAIEGTTT